MEGSLSAMGMKVLILDDDGDFCALLKRRFESLGCQQVICFHEPSQAFKSLVSQKLMPDLLVTDYQMPGMNGAEFTVRLRQSGIMTPIIICTGLLELDMVLLSREVDELPGEAMPLRILHKPPTLAELSEALGAVRTRIELLNRRSEFRAPIYMASKFTNMTRKRSGLGAIFNRSEMGLGFRVHSGLELQVGDVVADDKRRNYQVRWAVQKGDQIEAGGLFLHTVEEVQLHW